MDLDNFKYVGDTLGATRSATLLLREVAARLRAVGDGGRRGRLASKGRRVRDPNAAPNTGAAEARR